MIRFERKFIGEQEFPLVWEVTQGADASIDNICAWLAEQKPQIEGSLDLHGALLLRGFENLRSAEHFERILAVLALRLMDYIGGTSPRRVVRGRILTATDLHENYSIPLHQEMSYIANSPDRVAFFCEVPPTNGGETTVADARLITRRIDASVSERFEHEHKGVRLRLTLSEPESVHHCVGVPKSWTEVFDTTDRAQAERVAQEKGWEITWLPDGAMHLWQEILPASKTQPRTGDTVWFNQAHIFAPEASLRWASRDGWNEQWQQLKQALAEHPETVDHMFHGDGTQVSGEDATHLFDVFMHSEIPVRWQRGDVLLLDNVLAVHGRRSFVGERKILAALIRDRTAPTAEVHGVKSRGASCGAYRGAGSQMNTNSDLCFLNR